MEEINYILNKLKIKAICKNFFNDKNCIFIDLNLIEDGKISDITKNIDDITLNLKFKNKPIIDVLYELGIIRLKFIKNDLDLDFDLYKYINNHIKNNNDLSFIIGKNNQDLVNINLSSAPHILIAGTTGSGKTTLLHNIIGNCLSYKNIKLNIVDPKNIEFYKYSNIKNINYYHSYNDCLSLLSKLINIMEHRYDIIKSGFETNNIDYEVLIIDEFADLIANDATGKMHKYLCKLSQKSRAAKIHIILSTQRPSSNIINGDIKSNFPTRIACKVSSSVDSKIILDRVGAENLNGKGDAIIKDSFGNFNRFQTLYSDAEKNIKNAN